MGLRKACEHGHFDKHHIDSRHLYVGDFCRCPGGESVEMNGNTVELFVEAMMKVPFHGSMNRDFVRRLAVAAFLVIDPES